LALSSARDVLLTDANALRINGSSVRTIDARALGGNLTLAGNIVATGNSPTTSISLSTNQNFLNTRTTNMDYPSNSHNMVNNLLAMSKAKLQKGK
jgi:hypothetical protein